MCPFGVTVVVSIDTIFSPSILALPNLSYASCMFKFPILSGLLRFGRGLGGFIRLVLDDSEVIVEVKKLRRCRTCCCHLHEPRYTLESFDWLITPIYLVICASLCRVRDCIVHYFCTTIIKYIRNNNCCIFRYFASYF